MISTEQIKAARALLGWSQEDLSARSGVSYTTIAKIESSEGRNGARRDTLSKIVAALEEAGIELTDGVDSEGPGAHLRQASSSSRARPYNVR
jgi:transcriptional regulator with XRE-family HTH domain